MKKSIIGLVALFCVALVGSVNAQSKCCVVGADQGKKSVASVSQVKCPVTGEAIDSSLYADVNGKRVYVCCEGCIAKVKADPDAALAKVKANGETAEQLKPVILCGKCGEVKGLKKCCSKDAVKCKKCGLDKGAPGCCKMNGTGKNMVQCPKTGKLMACPLKGDKCDMKSLKAACKAGKVNGCPMK